MFLKDLKKDNLELDYKTAFNIVASRQDFNVKKHIEIVSKLINSNIYNNLENLYNLIKDNNLNQNMFYEIMYCYRMMSNNCNYKKNKQQFLLERDKISNILNEIIKYSSQYYEQLQREKIENIQELNIVLDKLVTIQNFLLSTSSKRNINQDFRNADLYIKQSELINFYIENEQLLNKKERKLEKSLVCLSFDNINLNELMQYFKNYNNLNSAIINPCISSINNYLLECEKFFKSKTCEFESKIKNTDICNLSEKVDKCKSFKKMLEECKFEYIMPKNYVTYTYNKINNIEEKNNYGLVCISIITNCVNKLDAKQGTTTRERFNFLKTIEDNLNYLKNELNLGLSPKYMQHINELYKDLANEHEKVLAMERQEIEAKQREEERRLQKEQEEQDALERECNKIKQKLYNKIFTMQDNKDISIAEALKIEILENFNKKYLDYNTYDEMIEKIDKFVTEQMKKIDKNTYDEILNMINEHKNDYYHRTELQDIEVLIEKSYKDKKISNGTYEKLRNEFENEQNRINLRKEILDEINLIELNSYFANIQRANNSLSYYCRNYGYDSYLVNSLNDALKKASEQEK